MLSKDSNSQSTPTTSFEVDEFSPMHINESPQAEKIARITE